MYLHCITDGKIKIDFEHLWNIVQRTVYIFIKETFTFSMDLDILWPNSRHTEEIQERESKMFSHCISSISEILSTFNFY